MPRATLAFLWITFLSMSGLTSMAAAMEVHDLTSLDKEFFVSLRAAVLNDEKEWLSEHISYPITVSINGEKVSITSQKAFIDNYESIFNCEVKDAVRNQNPEKLFKNWRGLMVGKDAIWFTAVIPDSNRPHVLEYYITGINN